MPRTVIDLVGTIFNKTNRNLGPHRAYILVGEAGNKQNMDMKYIVC